MAISNANHQLALVVSSNTTTSYEGLLESQKELLSKQIYELQNIVSKQCKLTGVNPLSQEMAAGALSIKIGKRPRDLLNPKAIKYMQSIFSVKDEISKKEIRAISALFGLTATQVRDFFTGQRSRIRRFIRLSREKAIQSAEDVQEQDGSLSSNLDAQNHPVPLNSMGPPSIEAPSCSTQDEVLPDTDDSDKYFIDNIFSLLRKEETFSGQVKLMEWILQIKNASVLYWFLTNGGVMILATWLSQAAIEEQTTVLHTILRVLCHLPLHKSLPAHMSAILQSVNKLRFYRGPDISNRAKSLLSRWSKMFARSQAMRRPNANISPGAPYLLQENSENSRNLGSSQSIKLLTAPSDESNIKLLRDTRERRKVQLVEQPGQKTAGRGPQVTRVVSTTQGRPLSADDIQKAKMRAQFMRSKYGESYVNPRVKTEVSRAASTSQAAMTPPSSKAAPIHPKVEEPATSTSGMTQSAAKSDFQPKAEEHKKPAILASADEVREATVFGKGNMELEEPVWKKCKRFQISWIDKEWSVCSGENSKEVDVQNNRIKREKEVFYERVLEIPSNPKEPWDLEMDYDDSLTPEIPTEQLPDDDDDNMVSERVGMTPTQMNIDSDVASGYAAGTSTNGGDNNNRSMPEPDLELLAVLLKNPEIVFALTAGQGGNLNGEQMVKLLDAIKANAARGGSIGSLVNGLVEKKAEEKVEVSLPSPTPSSNPVTSGWRPESAKNQFSRQSMTVNGEAYAIPAVNFQETGLLTPATITQQAFAPINHQRFPDLPLDQRNVSDFVPDRRSIPTAVSGLPFRGAATANLTQQSISPSIHQRFSDMVPDHGNIPAAGHGPPSSGGYFPSTHGGSQISSQRRVISEPRQSLVQSWSGRESLGSSPYSPAERNSNLNTYSTQEFMHPPPDLRAGPSWGRNGGHRDEPGFESWSPDNSPVRSHEYVDSWDYSDPPNRSYNNYRLDMSAMQHDPSRYRDRGGRNDGSRWRDRRR
ncbi:Homeodomain-containing protein [Cynara cardunculus var. scolymus]|uniref:Homeodomain-containing protein n=1 Tax=Cynara cardunculus var. scolymus TaxID=59895 RepID=A0A103YNS8_CYNCS|nr:Homeodomain-containing protein [Cynara cardunculus var. scolymus]